MGAPKGNVFWKLRSKHGRDKLFTSPELLWQAAVEYFEWCDANPWHKHESIKSGEFAGTTMKVPTQRPYSLGGFCLYCGTSEEWFRQFKHNEANKDYFGVCSEIEKTVETQQFEGATVGAFNASIIARKLGLTEKTESTNTNINYNSEMTPEEVKRIAKDLESEY